MSKYPPRTNLQDRILATRMATKQYLGHLSAFQQESDTISAYLERVQIFFDGNGIKEDKEKVPVFLNAVGARTYAQLRDLLSLDKPAAKTCVFCHLELGRK